jgi:hypothetical protein
MVFCLVQDNLMFTGGKEGTYFVLKSNAMGGYNQNNNDSNAYQFIPGFTAEQDSPVGKGGIYSGAAYWPAGVL